MATDKVNKNRSKKIITLVVAIVLAIMSYFGVEFTGLTDGSSTTENAHVTGTMEVHFIDVGNADATLVVQGDEAILIDAGTKGRGDDVVEYIESLGITELKAFIVTHPHDDHMGGASYVLDNIDIEVVYGPDIFEIEDIQTKEWYKMMMDSIEKIDEERNQGIPEEEWVSIWNLPRTPGDNDFVSFTVGQATVQFVAPNSDEYSDKNDYSIVSKITFGTTDVLVMGDATKLAEKEIIDAGFDIKSEVLRAGHHGSDTSSGRDFVNEVNPEYVVVSCGLNNRYDHPTEEFVSLMEELKLPLYRTDENGTIVMTTDGENIEFDKSPGTYENGEEKGA